jgi:hypothetical protein
MLAGASFALERSLSVGRLAFCCRAVVGRTVGGSQGLAFGVTFGSLGLGEADSLRTVVVVVE